MPPFAGTWYHIIRLVQARLDQFYSDNVHAQQASLHVCVCVCARARAFVCANVHARQASLFVPHTHVRAIDGEGEWR